MSWTWTEQRWKTASKEGKWLRSSRFKAIGAAVAGYNPLSDTAQRLRGMAAILDAISAWRIWKEREKLGHDDPNSKGVRHAADESALRAANLLAEDRDLSVRSRATDLLVVDVVKEIDDVLADERAGWGRRALSDPALHKAGADFTYLVTAQVESDPTPLYRQATVDNPDLIERAVISASVITRDSAHLWGPSGFILRAPKRCIAASYAEDLGVENAVAVKHHLEKYRELLRVYLRDGSGGRVGIRAPLEVLPKKAVQHSEVMVLGRSYDKLTRVCGIFVVVDKVASKGSKIAPAQCFLAKERYIKNGPQPKVTYVGVVKPSTTSERMEQYLKLSEARDLPIVQLPVSGGVHILPSTFNSLYGEVLFPYDANTMVLEESEEHRQLLADGGKTWKKVSST